ncbi:GAF domain-containing protein [Nocardioides endophyticus]|uniref:GAF domain-containing protein n=1 Tax=Nocardioides endophyticus TaxID=1353775 RepID=A0ABP8YHR7_9ACTN
MSGPGPRLAQVRALVENEDAAPGDQPGIVGRMQRLCRAASDALTARGVGICLIAEVDAQLTVAASGPVTEQVEGLQFALGEGPSLEAHAARRPVLCSDLRGSAGTRWPGYVPAVRAYGVRAVFSFPLQIGAARLGAMGVYREVVGGLSDEHLAQALTFAEVATVELLDSLPAPGGPHRVVQDAVDNRYEVYQAQGMLTVQLGVGLVEAMARMRAYAYAQDRLLGDLARDILAGRVVLEPDEP